MGGEPTIGGSLASALQFLSDVIFKWVPSVIASVSSTGYEQFATTTAPFATPLSQPLSASSFPTFLEQVSAPGVYDSLSQGWYAFTILSIVISLPFLGIIIYTRIRVFLLRRYEEQMFRAAQQPVAARDVPKTQLRWSRVLEQARSGSEHSWRLAILEADIMLNDLLDVRGYKGETIADKMKQVDRADFNSIDAAWEAHKVRNRIAHDGVGHSLSQREVRHVIGLYEKVFKEFRYIE